MKAWQERVMAEGVELNKKLIDLSNFLKSEEIEKLARVDQDDLDSQYYHMRRYASVLSQRIQRFTLDASRTSEQEIKKT